MRNRIILWITGVLIAAPAQAQDRSLPLLACEVTPPICAQSIQAYLDETEANGTLDPSDLGIIAARLARARSTGVDRRFYAEALALIGESMRAFDPGLAQRILLVAEIDLSPSEIREAQTGADDGPNAANPIGRPDTPILAPPVPASPS